MTWRASRGPSQDVRRPQGCVLGALCSLWPWRPSQLTLWGLSFPNPHPGPLEVGCSFLARATGWASCLAPRMCQSPRVAPAGFQPPAIPHPRQRLPRRLHSHTALEASGCCGRRRVGRSLFIEQHPRSSHQPPVQPQRDSQSALDCRPVASGAEGLCFGGWSWHTVQWDCCVHCHYPHHCFPKDPVDSLP